jgi:enoyl-CoA hydratase/carnithine racemase
MLAKLTSKNQLTLPKSVVEATGKAEYFEVEARNGQLVLTPVRIQRADAVRAKLAELDLGDDELAAAVAWARDVAQSHHPHAVNEDAATYGPAPARETKSTRRHRK